MKIYKSKLWQVKLPDDWDAESEDDNDVLFNEDGVGELHISTTQFDEPVSDEMLEDMAAEHLESGAELEEVEFDLFDGFTLDYEVDNEYWREWYLMSGNVVVYATYICDPGDEEQEEDVVEFILESLSLT